jgi:hypothetical protein
LRTLKVWRQQAANVKAVLTALKAHHTRVLKQAKLHKQYPNDQAFQGPINFNPGLQSKKIKFAHDDFCVEAKSLTVTTDSTVSMYRNTKPHNGGHYLFRSIRTQKGLLRLLAVATAQDFKVHYRHGKPYFILPERQVLRVRVRVPEGGEAVAAVGHGVRTSFTAYSPQGSVVELGTNTYQVVDKLRNRIERAKVKLWCDVQRAEETQDGDRNQ